MMNGSQAERFFPTNVVAMIFSNLGIYEMARCACVSKSWWYASRPAIHDKKVKMKDAWLNGDFDLSVVGEVEIGDYRSLWLEENLIAVCGKGLLKFWYLDEDKVIDASENVGSKTLLDLCFFDGEFFTGDDEGYITAWDPSNGNDLFTVEAHGMGVSSLLKRGDYLASVGCDDLEVKLWRKAEKRGLLRCNVLKGHTAQVNSIDFSKDGKLLFSGSDDNTIRVWDIASGACIKVFKCDGEVWALSIHRENQVLCGYCREDPMLSFLEISSGTVQSKMAMGSIATYMYNQLHDWYILICDGGAFKISESLQGEHCLEEFHINFEMEELWAEDDRLCFLSKSGEILLWDPFK